MLGFTCHIYPFGWDSGDAGSYPERIQKLIEFVQSFDGDIYILGVSAGGTTAVTSYAMSAQEVAKVVTLCAPLAAFDYRVNPLLEVAITHTQQSLAKMPAAAKRNILSLHAVYDQVVPTKLSQSGGVKQKTLVSFWHVPTIVLGLTLFSPAIIRFYKQR